LQILKRELDKRGVLELWREERGVRSHGETRETQKTWRAYKKRIDEDLVKGARGEGPNRKRKTKRANEEKKQGEKVIWGGLKRFKNNAYIKGKKAQTRSR